MAGLAYPTVVFGDVSQIRLEILEEI